MSQPPQKTSAAETWLFPVYFYVCAFLTATCAALVLHKNQQKTLAAISNFMGSLVENLAHGGAYVTCSSGMTAAGDVLCFHANRMPLPPFLLLGLIHIFGDRYRAVELAKIAIVLLPVAAAFALAWTAPRPISRRRTQILIPIVLLSSLLLPTQLIDVINMQVEEGYSFCLLAYTLAVLLFGMRRQAGKMFMPWRTTLFFAIGVLFLYLTKSSMIAVSLFLVLSFCWQVRDLHKRMAVVLIFLCGPVSWGLYTFRTGHFSIGTSVDGINLHKGNYYEFLDRYPPPPGISLDPYDAGLNRGKFFTDEWTFNAYHMRLAEDYMRAYPVRTMRALLWKAEVFFLSVHKIGSERYSGWLGWMTTASMLCFRLLLWTACGLAAWLLWRGPATVRWPAFLYLGTTFSIALPYLIGFALTRHASVLVLPSALFLCWCFLQVPPSGAIA
jgi:hypothetical protein